MIRGMIPALLMSVLLLAGCGKKPEEERNSLVITAAETAAMIDMIQHGGDIIEKMCGYILDAKKTGIYNGAYRAVELAVGKNK